ncbi:MAG: nitrilase-related carbon-nitrogen hydrolase, partial [Candidatus Njordarchaeota archaeon]
RALENRVYIISANRIGIEGDLTFTGQTIIVNPKGEVIAMASKTQEEIIYADIDLSVARDKNITPKNNIFEDRAPDAYYLDK